MLFEQEHCSAIMRRPANAAQAVVAERWARRLTASAKPHAYVNALVVIPTTCTVDTSLSTSSQSICLFTASHPQNVNPNNRKNLANPHPGHTRLPHPPNHHPSTPLKHRNPRPGTRHRPQLRRRVLLSWLIRSIPKSRCDCSGVGICWSM